LLNGLTLILCCQLAGELLTRSLGGILPGPVIGMVILFVLLMVVGRIPSNTEATADTLLGNFSLLFVPAGVGVMVHFRLLGDNWIPLSVSLVASTVLTIVVTGLLMSWLKGRGRGNEDPAPGGQGND
jgi:putative effector of murein hydrolase LrgA (UPF0299 family)